MTRRTFLARAGAAAVISCPATRAFARASRGGGQSPQPAPAPQAQPEPRSASEEFEVRVGSRTIRPRLVTPDPGRLARRPLLLLNLCGERETALTAEPYCLAARAALSQGHRAVSFDLPNHGPRRDHFGEGIQGWRNAWVAGEDRLGQAVEEASTVIGWCVEHSWAEPGRVVVYGISRGGYLALRVLAGDMRVAAAAAVAPVTDWRELSEFSAEKGREDLAALSLVRYVGALAGKRLFIVIGNADDRVSTLSCCRLFLALEEANATPPRRPSPVEFHCVAMAQPGHVVDDSWRKLGAEFLLRAAEDPGKASSR